MKKTLRFLFAFLIAFAIMMVVRAVGVTIYTVSGTSMEPMFLVGDRLMVNRWSYGLRVGGKDSFFDYGRIARQSIEKGDLVALEHPQDRNQILICRCTGLPGDTVYHDGQVLVMPSINDCADADYYRLEFVGPIEKGDSRTIFIAEEYIIGRAFMVVYSRNPSEPLWKGWRANRLLLPI